MGNLRPKPRDLAKTVLAQGSRADEHVGGRRDLPEDHLDSEVGVLTFEQQAVALHEIDDLVRTWGMELKYAADLVESDTRVSVPKHQAFNELLNRRIGDRIVSGGRVGVDDQEVVPVSERLIGEAGLLVRPGQISSCAGVTGFRGEHFDRVSNEEDWKPR